METLRIGLVGTGGIGRTHIERINNTLQGGKVVACADANIDFCKSVAEKYGIKAYEKGEDMIAADDIDAVVVTTLDPFHEQYVMAAIKAGKYGQPLMLHCVHRNYDAPGFTTSMPVENSMIHEIDVLRWLLGENYKTAEVVFPKTTRNAEGELRDPQIMYLTTESGVRIDVESFVNCRYGYDVRCEVVCEEGCINLPEPANAMIRTNDSRVTPICHDWSERFPEAYNIEFQSWINACKEGRVDGPSAWDGYVGQVTAKAASKARDTQTVVEIHYDEMPDFYKK